MNGLGGEPKDKRQLGISLKIDRHILGQPRLARKDILYIVV